jgi:hypothetical protein
LSSHTDGPAIINSKKNREGFLEETLVKGKINQNGEEGRREARKFK